MKADSVEKLILEAYEDGLYMGRKIGSEPSESKKYVDMGTIHLPEWWGRRRFIVGDFVEHIYDPSIKGKISVIDHVSSVATVDLERGGIKLCNINSLVPAKEPKEHGDMIDPEYHRGYLQGRLFAHNEIRPAFQRMLEELESALDSIDKGNMPRTHRISEAINMARAQGVKLN